VASGQTNGTNSNFFSFKTLLALQKPPTGQLGMGPVTAMPPVDSKTLEVGTKGSSGLLYRDSPPINRSPSPNQLIVPTTKSPATQKNILHMSDVTEIKGKYDRV
jgi:hypothetical protein